MFNRLVTLIGMTWLSNVSSERTSANVLSYSLPDRIKDFQGISGNIVVERFGDGIHIYGSLVGLPVSTSGKFSLASDTKCNVECILAPPTPGQLKKSSHADLCLGGEDLNGASIWTKTK